MTGPAAIAAGVALGILFVMIGAVVIRRRGGLRITVDLWWGNGRGGDPQADQ